MSNYEQQYYILSSARVNGIPFLGPDENTAERNFSFERQPVGSAPLVFGNKEKERYRAEGVKDVVSAILFHGNNLVVRTSIRDALLDLNVPNMCMHPAIFVDDGDKWHEGYWYVTFTELFDCWDRNLSDASTSFVETEGERRYDVYEYVFDKELMDNTPLNTRLFFKMGGTIGAFVFCHESIAGIFRREVPMGARLVLAEEY